MRPAISGLGVALSYTSRKADRKEGGLDGDYSENLPWLSQLRRCPLIYHQKNGANGDGNGIFF